MVFFAAHPGAPGAPAAAEDIYCFDDGVHESIRSIHGAVVKSFGEPRELSEATPPEATPPGFRMPELKVDLSGFTPPTFSSNNRKVPGDPVVPFGDPLTEVTRKERRSLLGVGMVAIIMVEAGLFPKQIQSLGLTFEPQDRVIILWVLVAVIAYYLLSFAIHLIRDHLNTSAGIYRSLHKVEEDALTKLYSRPPGEVVHHETLFKNLAEIDRRYWNYIHRYNANAGKVRVFAVALDSGLPLVVAAVAIIDVFLLIQQKKPLLKLLSQLLG